MKSRGRGCYGGRRIWPLVSAKLSAQARRRTGLSDFGAPALEPALSTLTRSLEDEAGLHLLGRFLMRTHLRDLLQTRLQLTEAWRQDGIAGEAPPVERPVFIAGMPRSGSTFLHELLAQDPDSRAPRVWEVMFPVAGRGDKEKDRRRRMRKAEFCLWWFRRLAPAADSVYPMRACTPHECVAIQSYTLMSEEFVTTCQIPSYEKFLRATDLRPTYLWERRFLQYLQAGCEPRRWTLKSPDHVYGLEALFSVFPDAVIIHTHRNPLHVLRSCTELTRVLRGLYARPAGVPEALTLREAQELAEGAERAIRFRDEHPELAERFIDVRYSELVADPLGTVAQIYQRMDAPFSAVAEERMRRLASSRSRYEWHRRKHGLESLRLAASAELTRFERYCSRFGLSRGERV
jgi:hypothetical protein